MRLASSRARSTETPRASPVAASRVARTGLPKLIAARSLPLGASSATASGVDAGAAAAGVTAAGAAANHGARMKVRAARTMQFLSIDSSSDALFRISHDRLDNRVAPSCVMISAFETCGRKARIITGTIQMGTRLDAIVAAAAVVVAAQATAQVTFYEAEGFRGNAF